MTTTMSCFVACWKRTLHQSLAAINILEANSGLEMSEERRPLRQFREHPRRSFEPGRSIWPHHFEKSRKHSNESRSSVLLKLKPGPDNDAQLEVSSGGPVDGSHTRWHGIALIPWMRPAGRTRTRRAFAAAELDERQRQRDSSPWLPPARTMSPLLSPASIAPDWRSRSPFLRRTFSLRHASHCGVLRLSASSREHPPEGTVPSPALPAIVPLAAPCSLLALAPPIACAFSAATLRRARTSSHESSGRRSTVTDARDLPRKVTASLLARPAIVPLAAPCSLSTVVPFVACAFSATTPCRARASSRGRTERPATTPSDDSEATAPNFFDLWPGHRSLAPACHLAERTDCADRAADAARNGKRISDAERGSSDSERRLIVAPARRRKAVLCSVISCATPF